MINIRFDNPYLLLLLIPMLAAVIVPFAIAIRKENKSRSTAFALISHILIVILVTLAIAGMHNISVITETELYVLADVSHSANERLELIDSYIEDLEDQLPRNSSMGVITFAKDTELTVPLGEKLVSISESGVDRSATDIVSAMRYAHSLFGESSIKRVVLYTDGMSTDPSATGELVRVIEDMKADDVYIDVVYIDSNMNGDVSEVQISEVNASPSTYLGNSSTADVLIESNTECGVILRVTRNGETFSERTVDLNAGYNIVNIPLDTTLAGEFDYTIEMIARDDLNDFNNKFSFNQRVNSDISVLLITEQKDDVGYVEALYGDKAIIESFVKPKDKTPTSSDPSPKPVVFDVPFTVEELVKYDQIILSNVDVNKINNSQTFVKSLDTVVSAFGKTLLTAGNNQLAHSETDVSIALSDMLPIKFGNNDSDKKIYAIVIDSSRSMEFKNFDFFAMAKLAANYLLDLLNEGDYFSVVHFSGEVYIPMPPRQATKENIAEAKALINDLEVTQGTMIGRTLEKVYDFMKLESFDNKQVMLISDGMSFEGGETLSDDPIAAATKLYANNITVSTMNTGNDEGIDTMKSIAAAGGGNYYFVKSSEDMEAFIFTDVADDVTETEVLGSNEVFIDKPRDPVLEGVDSLPSVYGYIYSKSKASANNVLFVNYTKKNGTLTKAPLYSHWNYGNGKVASLATNLGGEWISLWQDSSGDIFLDNIFDTGIPKERIDYPYAVEASFDGKYTHIEIIPAVLNPDATMTVRVTLPDGEQLEEKLTFDSYRYFYKLETGVTGKYVIETTYDWQTKSYSSSTMFTISYPPEYNSFVTFTPADLYTAVRANGTVTEGENATLTVDESKISTYILRFTVPFLALAAVLYIIDTVVRKLKWADIRSFFKIRKKEGKK